MLDCCDSKNTSKACIRKHDEKIFKLPRKFTKKRCLEGIKGFTMRSSCAPFKHCKSGGSKYKNILNDTLKVCSNNPITGYTRNGYCVTDKRDRGNHLVCAKMDKRFLDFTASKGNNLRNVVKEGDNWCLCQERWLESYNHFKQPKVIESATNQKTRKNIRNIILKQYGGKRTKKQFLYNPNDPRKSFDVYIDKNPNDTISIKYKTVEDVKSTIRKLEKIYKSGDYSHKRIWQVGMIMKVRLQAMLKHKKTRYPNAKNVETRYRLANRYFKFLGQRSKADGFQNRKGMTFTF